MIQVVVVRVGMTKHGASVDNQDSRQLLVYKPYIGYHHATENPAK